MIHAAITKGTGAERPHVPVHLLRYCLWLADAGYVSHDLFKAIADVNGFFLVREKQDMNPLVKSVTIYEGTKFIQTKVFEQPIKLKDLGPSYNLQRTYDMEVVLSNGLTCRAIKCFNPNKSKRSEGEDEFAYFCTNLTKDLFDFEQVLAIYQARWGIEIDWKILKHYNSLRADRLLKNSVINAMLYFSLFCQGLKMFCAQVVEPYLGGKKISPLKVASRTGAIVRKTLAIAFKGVADSHEHIERLAHEMFRVFSGCTKAKPSKSNREKGKGVYCIIKKLKRPMLQS